MTWPRPSFLELIQQFPEPLFIRMLEVGCDGGRCDARLDRDQVRSMPTSETRADASMTMPLSRTRSSTSISDARKMPRVFRHLVRNNYKRVDRNMWLRICRNYARGAHCQHYNPGTGAEGSSPPKHKVAEEPLAATDVSSRLASQDGASAPAAPAAGTTQRTRSICVRFVRASSCSSFERLPIFTSRARSTPSPWTARCLRRGECRPTRS